MTIAELLDIAYHVDRNLSCIHLSSWLNNQKYGFFTNYSDRAEAKPDFELLEMLVKDIGLLKDAFNTLQREWVQTTNA